MIHVTNRTRWNRVKGWIAFGFFISAIISVGGLEGEGTAHYDIAFICLSLCAGLWVTIARRKM